MDYDKLATQFGGKPVEPNLDELAAKFGGGVAKPTQDVNALAAQFGGAPAAPAEMKAWEPTAFEEIVNVGKRGLLQAEATKNALAFKAGLMDAATYTEKTRELNRRMGAAAPSGDVAAGIERLQDANATGNYGTVAKELVKPKNLKALGALVGESMVSTAENIPAVVAGGITGGPVGAAGASGATSFAAEYGAAIGDLLEKKGIDPSDTLAVRNALEDPKFLAEANERGLKRGIPVGVLDAVSAGFAGRFLRALEKAAPFKSVAKATAKEAGLQIGSGMAGEALGQAATGETKPLDVILEGLAELPGGIAEAGSNLYSARRAQPMAEAQVGEAPEQAAETPEEQPATTAKIHEWSDAALETTLIHQLDKPEGERNTALVDSILTEIDSRAQEQGAENAGEPIDGTSGVSPDLAGQPSTVEPTAGVAEPVSDRVVSAGENAPATVEGAGEQPAALTEEAPAATAEEQPAPTPQPEITIRPAYRMNSKGVDVRDGYDVFVGEEWGNRYPTKRAAQAAVEEARAQQTAPAAQPQSVQEAVQEPVQPTEGAPVGAETPEAVQAEAQGQEAPTAAGVTPAAPITPVTTLPAGVAVKGKKKKRDRTKARTQVELKKAFVKANDNYEKSRASTKFKGRGIRQKIADHMDPQQLMEWVKSFWPQAKEAQREVMARLPSIEFLGDWVKEFGLDQISRAADMMTAVLGKQKVMAEETERLIYMLKRAFKADPTLQEKLERVVYTSTTLEVDPSDPNAKERVPELDSAYEALGETGQNLYKMVKEHYEKRAAEYLQLLEDHINSLPNADEATKKHLLVTLRKHYEASKRIHPYFPLVRDEGEYWLSVGKGEKKEFYIYDSLRARDADRARMMKERGLEADDFDSGNSVESLRQDAVETSAFLRAVFDAIEATPAQKNETDQAAAKYKESLKDAIYQTYLNVMPERSFRGMFRHRKGRAGYRTDLVQNIASVDGKINSQLARLEYGQQLRNLVDSAQTSIQGREDLQPFVTELGKRVDSFLTPAPHNAMDAVAGLAGRVGFTYLLGGLSLPFLQPMALATSGLGILWGNYKSSAARVGAELTRALLDLPSYGYTTPMPDGSVRYHWPSLVNSKKLTGDELRAVRELGASGVHESTLARSVWEHAKNPTSSYVMEPGKELEYAAARTMKGIDTVVGSPFHIAERWTREALFLAAYRLGIKDGLGHEAAVKKAFDNIKEALGDYDSHAKPRWMQRGLGKMAFALKTFAVLITQQTVGNLFKAIPLLNKEGKIEAIKKFSGIMLTTSVLAGASGAPLASVFYSFVAGMLMAMGGDDDDSDEEKDLKSMDPGLWFRSVWLPKHIPNVEIGGVDMYDWIDRGVVNALTGLDVASRLQLSSVWGSEIPKTAKTTKEAALNLAADYLGGAYFSMVTQWMNARDAYAAGDEQRAKELASPKFMRDWMKADRYEREGVMSAGKEVLPAGALTDLELWGQRIGFSPDIVAVNQKEGMKASAGLQKAGIERSQLLNKLDIALQKNTAEGDAEFDRIMDEEVDAYNKKYPSLEMKDRDIQEALKSREKERDNAVAGITVTKKQADALEPLFERMERRLEKRVADRKEQVREAAGK